MAEDTTVTHRSTVALELAALEERLRDDCQRLLLDAVDAVDAVNRVRAQMSVVSGGLKALAGGDEDRFGELVESSGLGLLFAVLERASVG